MAAVPVYDFQIDWGNGYVSMQRLADNWSVNWSARAAPNGKGVSAASASGSVRILNDGRYDPDGPDNVIPENNLRRANPCRILHNGTEWIVGTARMDKRRGAGEIRWITFHWRGLRSDGLTTAEMNLDLPSGSVNSIAEEIAEAAGITLVFDSPQQTGSVVFKGNPLYCMEFLSRYSGGWCLEKRDGTWEFFRWQDSVNLTPTPIDLSYGPLLNSTSVGERSGWVRNYCLQKGKQVTTGIIGALSTVTTRIRRSEVKTVTLSLPPKSTNRFTRFEVSPEHTARITRVDRSVPTSVRVTLLGTTTSNVGSSVKLTGYGNVTVTEDFQDRELEITEFDTQQVYGRREYPMPPWFPESYEDGDIVIRPWLRQLSQPPNVMEVAWSAAQPTNQQSNRLRDAIDAGAALDVSYVAGGQEKVFKGLVVACSHRWSRERAGTFGAVLIERRDRARPPLGASAQALDDKSAKITASSPSHNYEDLYVRVRTA